MIGRFYFYTILPKLKEGTEEYQTEFEVSCLKIKDFIEFYNFIRTNSPTDAPSKKAFLTSYGVGYPKHSRIRNYFMIVNLTNDIVRVKPSPKANMVYEVLDNSLFLASSTNPKPNEAFNDYPDFFIKDNKKYKSMAGYSAQCIKEILK